VEEEEKRLNSLSRSVCLERRRRRRETPEKVREREREVL
jgi:hypothetical protein